MKQDALWVTFWTFSIVALIDASQGMLLVMMAIAAPFLLVAIGAWILDTKISPERK